MADSYAATCLVDGEHWYSCARVSSVGRSATRLLAVGPNSAVEPCGVDRRMPHRWRVGRKADPPAGNVAQAVGDGCVAGVAAGGDVVDPVPAGCGNRWQQPYHRRDADIVLGGRGGSRGTPRFRSRCLRAAPVPGTSPAACRCRRRSTGVPRAPWDADRRGTAPRRRASSGCRGRRVRLAVRAALRLHAWRSRAHRHCVDDSSRKEFELQLAKAAGDEPDMGLRRVQRAHAEIAGEADAVDDMACRPARRQQRRQRSPRDWMDHVILAFQPGDQCRTDEAAGAEDGES